MLLHHLCNCCSLILKEDLSTMSTVTTITKVNPIENLKMSLSLIYGVASTKFGNSLAAFKDNILCFFTFFDKQPPLEILQKTWPKAILTQDDLAVTKKIDKLFSGKTDNLEIYLRGTEFEMEVWEALLNVKKGTTATYAEIAANLGRPKSMRAVGRAVGKNNIAYFIPCHRIVSKNGDIKYGGGPQRKVRILRDEGVM